MYFGIKERSEPPFEAEKMASRSGASRRYLQWISFGYAGLCQALTVWCNDVQTPWLADAPTHPLQQTLKDLERTYRNFFEKRGLNASLRYPDAKQFKLNQNHSRIFLPKLGWVQY